MVQSPSWEANLFAASEEIPRISRNPKVHYRTHKRPPPVSILGQPNPVHIPTSNLLEIHPNIHPSTPRSPQWSPSFRFPQQDPIHPNTPPSPHTYAPHAQPISFFSGNELTKHFKYILCIVWSSSSCIFHGVGPLVKQTRSGLTYPEVSSKVYHYSICQSDSSISLPWVIYFEAFYLHAVSSFSCIPVICPKLVLFLTPLQFVHLFCSICCYE